MSENQGRVKVTVELLQDLDERELSISSIFPEGTKIDVITPFLDDGYVEYVVRGDAVPSTEGATIPEIECFFHTDREGDITFSMFKLSRRF